MLDAAREIVRGGATFAKQAVTAGTERGVVAGVSEGFRLAYTGAWRARGLLSSRGVPVYEREWDVLVVLDACRADLMAEVADRYPFTSRRTTDSVASCSPEWMDKNFSSAYRDEVANTVYVTGNRYADSHVDEAEFHAVDKVYEYAWDDRGTVPPAAVTDRAIAAGRTYDADRFIVHYMQPHHPFLPTPLAAGMAEDMADRRDFGDLEDVWTRLRWRELSRDDVWSAYKDTLCLVLDQLRILTDNIEGDLVITSDHGNAMGEHWMYGHPMYAPHDVLREVPWCRTAATDTGRYEVDESLAADAADPSRADTPGRKEQLAALGYT